MSIQLCRQTIDDEENDVMPRLFVLRQDFETGNQTNLWSFSSNSINRKSKIQQPVLSEAEGIQNRLVLSASFSLGVAFLWRSSPSQPRGSLAFFFLFLITLAQPQRLRPHDNRFLFNYRSENRKCRQIGSTFDVTPGGN